MSKPNFILGRGERLTKDVIVRSGGGPKQALRELSNTYDLSGLVDRLEPDFRAVEESIKSERAKVAKRGYKLESQT